MSKTTAILCVLGGLLAGVSLGSRDPEPPVEYRVVKLPGKVVTHVETREVPVYEPMPESCTDMTEYLDQIVRSATQQTAASGRILLGLTDVQKFSTQPFDFAAANRAIQVVRDNKDKLDTSEIHLQEAIRHFESAVNQCKQDTQTDD